MQHQPFHWGIKNVSQFRYIWDELINMVKNGTTYEFQTLKVKHFKGCTQLAIAPTTTFKVAIKQLEFVQGPTPPENLIK